MCWGLSPAGRLSFPCSHPRRKDDLIPDQRPSLALFPLGSSFQAKLCAVCHRHRRCISTLEELSLHTPPHVKPLYSCLTAVRGVAAMPSTHSVPLGCMRVVAFIYPVLCSGSGRESLSSPHS